MNTKAAKSRKWDLALEVDSANLTQQEVPHLPQRYNLTDGHVHRKLTSAERSIIRKLPTIFQKSNRERQSFLEEQFCRVTYRLAEQTSALDPTIRRMLSVSASMSIEILANFLRLHKFGVALIEPCFDNIPDILGRHGIPLRAVPESILSHPERLEEYLIKGSSALFLVCPNNPTGKVYTKESLAKIAQVCTNRRVLLIIDASFRYFKDPKSIFDEYALLLSTGVQFVFIEDTGKTWPTQELKVSVLATNSTAVDDLYRIYTDFILNISPFSLAILTSFMRHSIADKLKSVKAAVSRNEIRLKRAIARTDLEFAGHGASSVAWIRAKRSNAEFVDRLSAKGVYVLRGDRFFWSNPMAGRQYIRVALAREPALFNEACEIIADVCRLMS